MDRNSSRWDPLFHPEVLGNGGCSLVRTRKEIDRRFVQDFTLNVTSFHGSEWQRSFEIFRLLREPTFVRIREWIKGEKIRRTFA